VRSFQLPAVALVMAAAVFSGSLMAGTVSPASAAVRPPTAPMILVSGNGRPAVDLRTALNRVRRTGGGQFALASAGLSSRARSADAADVAPAADQGTTMITIVPGTTLTISSTEVVLDISAQDVTDIENGAALGSAIASLVGAILSLASNPTGSAIAAIVASSLNIGSDVLKVCAGNDGGSVILSVSVPTDGLPSVSACGISI
jgi:hypothetical protein